MQKIVEVIDQVTGEVKYRKVLTDFTGDPGRTKPEFADEVNINSIVARVRKGHPAPVRSRGVGVFGDFSAPQDFTAAAEAVADARDRFLALPAAVKDRMRQSPSMLLEALADDAQVLELLELGLPREYASQAVLDQFDQLQAHATISRVSRIQAAAVAPPPAVPAAQSAVGAPAPVGSAVPPQP